MNLAELKNKARAAAKRVEDRLTAAIGEGRELTAAEEASNTADEAELADLNGQIASAEGGAGTPASTPTAVELHLDGAAIAAAAVAGEQTRILALVDLCPSSSLSDPLRTAIEGGQDAGAFAIGLAQAAKTRGASMDDLRSGAVQEDQIPVAGKGAAKGAPGVKKAGLVDRVAGMGHRGLAHLKG